MIVCSVRFLTKMVFLFVLTFSHGLFAQTKQKLSCSRANVKADGKFFILNNKSKLAQAKLFLIKNNSKQKILLNRIQEGSPHASAGWGSYLTQRHWSALVLSQPRFILSCSTPQARGTNYVNCSKFIQVCEANIHLNENQGGYWLVENTNWDELIKKIFKKTNPH